MKLSKTDYLAFRDCPKNAWIKIHKPKVFKLKPLSAFDKLLFEVGNEVDEMARELFPGGILVEKRDDEEKTTSLISDKAPIIFQPVFTTERYKVIPDILVWNKEMEAYDIIEAKSSSSGDNKKAKDDIYIHDLAFQYTVLKEINVPVNKVYIMRLNSEYVRGDELDKNELFTKEDFTESVLEIVDEVSLEMENAYNALSPKEEPLGSCSCIIKGRNSHCVTFSYSNPDVPAYSVHDISRIGSSKKKLAELIDSRILSIQDVPEDFKLSEIQRNQIDVAQSGKNIVDRDSLKNFFDSLEFPISFLDYETFPAAIPRFKGYSPYNQIPFQFSLHVLNEEGGELVHSDFIFTQDSNPDISFITALQEQLPSSGSIVIWNKSFEMGINMKLSKRNPEHESFLVEANSRMVDLEDPFKKQFFVHPGFKGKTSIKSVLPTLAPELSYKDLDVQEGATASDTWNKIATGQYEKSKADKKTKSLLEYCKLDTKAMYAIWKYCMDKLK